MLTTRAPLGPAPAPVSPAGGWRAAPRGLPARPPAGHAGVLADPRSSSSCVPCACFLVLCRLAAAVRPGLAVVHADLPAPGADRVDRGRDRQLAVGVAPRRPCSGWPIGFPIAWLAARTTLPGRRLVARRHVAGAAAAVLAARARLGAAGPAGRGDVPGRARLALGHPPIMGPFGVVLLLGLRCVPFTFLAITAALAGLGQEFEDAARVHGACRAAALRLIVPILAPAIWSALAIGFAESISDFGVAATLAYNSNFTLATYQLYAAIGNFPPNFPLAPRRWLAAGRRRRDPAARCRPGRCAGGPTRCLSGRTRQVIRRRLQPGGRGGGGGRGRGCSSWWSWASPGFGAVSALAARRLRRLVHAHAGQLPRAVPAARADRAAASAR